MDKFEDVKPSEFTILFQAPSIDSLMPGQKTTFKYKTIVDYRFALFYLNELYVCRHKGMEISTNPRMLKIEVRITE